MGLFEKFLNAIECMNNTSNTNTERKVAGCFTLIISLLIGLVIAYGIFAFCMSEPNLFDWYYGSSAEERIAYRHYGEAKVLYLVISAVIGIIVFYWFCD